MRNRTMLIFALMAASILTACGGASPAPAEPSPITLTTRPDPPVPGLVELIIDVKDDQEQPVDEANILVLISHTSMSGMDQRGPATAREKGRYTFTAEMSGMSGEWLVTVQVRKDDLNIAQDFRVEVK